MQILISDANVLIDMDVGGLLEQMFQLPYTFQIPDMLFVDELESHHPELLGYGLQSVELDEECMIDAGVLVERYSGPSRYDCFALSLAKQRSAPLLSGDKALRKAAKKERVEVKGSLWVVTELVIHGVISKDQALAAYKKMEAAGSRLPWDDAHRMLEEAQST